MKSPGKYNNKQSSDEDFIRKSWQSKLVFNRITNLKKPHKTPSETYKSDEGEITPGMTKSIEKAVANGIKKILPSTQKQSQLNSSAQDAKCFELFFDAETSIVQFTKENAIRIYIPHNSLMNAICKMTAKRKVCALLSWDEIYEEAHGMEPENTEKGMRSIYDATQRLNKKIQDELNSKEVFFEFTRKSVRRNF